MATVYTPKIKPSSSWLGILKPYCRLCKPKVVALIMLSAIVGVVLHPLAPIYWLNGIIGLIGIGMAASSAAIINHYIDQHIDRKMQRTAIRPLVIGSAKPKPALILASTLGAISFLILYLGTNPFTAWMTFATLIGYAIIYTAWLKHQTPQNIVIGGITGALPPLLGWSAIDGTTGAAPWLLVIIIFLWTPPHFWALAIYRIDDYAKSKLPMLCNTHGIAYTKKQMVLYSILTAISTYLPVLVGMSGLIYAVGVSWLNWFWLRDAWRLQYTDDPRAAHAYFIYSIKYLMWIFLLLIVDHLWKIII